jgi:hypothetical protein
MNSRGVVSMAIEIPNEWLGEPIKGSMEKVLAEKPKEQPVTTRTNAPDLNGFEYIPSLRLYIAKQKELHNKNWKESRTALHERGDRMPTPYEFTEFTKHLRTKNDDEARTILDEIYKVEGNWRSEWLDAEFSIGKGGVIMRYHEFDGSEIKQRHIDLREVLMEDRKPGIDLDTWLSDNEYGLPKPNISNGSLWYWHPRDNTVAGFLTDSNRAGLDCYGDPDYRNSSLGVRAVRRFAENSGGKK